MTLRAQRLRDSIGFACQVVLPHLLPSRAEKSEDFVFRKMKAINNWERCSFLACSQQNHRNHTTTKPANKIAPDLHHLWLTVPNICSVPQWNSPSKYMILLIVIKAVTIVAVPFVIIVGREIWGNISTTFSASKRLINALLCVSVLAQPPQVEEEEISSYMSCSGGWWMWTNMCLHYSVRSISWIQFPHVQCERLVPLNCHPGTWHPLHAFSCWIMLTFLSSCGLQRSDKSKQSPLSLGS